MAAGDRCASQHRHLRARACGGGRGYAARSKVAAPAPVERRYWLNTARFHPVEKTLQMCLDSLPFLLPGVDARVLALYYIAYATNGFFQHCNIALRYGILNYIVGSAETHRWHHSRVPREANSNYGNTVILRDVIFGTWYLPNDRERQDLGLHEHDHPKHFLGLMKAPFTRRGH